MLKRFVSAFFVFVLILSVAGCKHKHKLDSFEALAYSRLKVAALQSYIYGFGEISVEDFNYLKQAARKYDKNTDWFSGTTGFTTKYSDTEKTWTIYLCDGDYCAKFVFEDGESADYLVDFEFFESTDGGYRIYIRGD